MRRVDSPSIVPEIVSDAALAAAVAMIQQLAEAKREGNRDAVPQFERVPGLRETVHEIANGKTFGEAQGARSRDRKKQYAKRKVARARAFQQRRMDPTFADYSDSDLKELCGKRLVRDPTSEGKYLRILARRQSILAIDEGLALIATGRFVLSC